MKKRLIHRLKMIFNWRYRRLYTNFPGLYRALFEDDES